MSIRQFILMLRARWAVVLTALAIVLGAALAASLLLPKKYTASTALLIDVKSADPILGAVIPGVLMPGYMATQVDIITSEQVARRVVTMLKLDEAPEVQQQWRDATDGGRGTVAQWMAPLLEKKLDVKPARESNVINIDFSAPDAQFAAKVANAFAQAYIETSLQLKVEPAKQYAAWFDARTKQLRDDLEKAQQALSAYQREKGIVGTDERLDFETARLNDISSQLTQIQGLRADTSSRQRQAAAGSDSMQEVLQNPVISSLKTDLARAEAKLQDAQSRLGTNHPEYLKAQSEIGSLRERIALETRRVASSLGDANQINVQREADLRAALEAQKKRVLQLKEERDGLSVLQRDVEGAQRAYDLVTQRLAQTSLESQSQQTNIAVLTPAEAPLEPSSPKLLLNALIAICMGTLLGVGIAVLLELMKPRVRSAEDLSDALGVPVLAVISRTAT